MLVPRNSSAAQAGERDIELVDVNAGSVVLRDDRVGRIWRVEIQPFRIARCPVTCAQYRDILGLAPSAGDDTPPLQDSDGLPVVEVSWYEAIAFCNALSAQCGLPPCYTISGGGMQVTLDTASDGYRLPSEAEWQYACQAGDDRVRYGELDAIAWYRENSGGQRHPVGQKQPNRWGLHDMIGNVWEWCWDVYDPQVYGEYRVFRGGGWADAHWGCTAASRRRSHPTFRIDDLGFRLARSG